MRHLYDENAPKKATNLSLNSDLLAKSRALKINLSATLEQALPAAAGPEEPVEKENEKEAHHG